MKSKWFWRFLSKDQSDTVLRESPNILTEPFQWSAEAVRNLFRKSADFHMDRYEVGSQPNVHSLYLLYCEGMTDSKQINNLALPQLQQLVTDNQSILELDTKWDLKRVFQPKEAVHRVFSGELVLYFEKVNVLFALDISNPPNRKPEESNVEISIKGPKDAFVEDLTTNVALVRKRLRSNSLCYEKFIIGKRSQSKVALLYIDDITRPEIVEEARNRLQHIDIDVLFSSAQLEEIIADRSFAWFPLLDFTTRPDYVVDSLIRGRVAIIVDGAPNAVMAPANLTLLLKTPEDIYLPYYMGTFGLWIRFLGLVISLLLPGFWTALASYNMEQLPYPLLATIAMSRMGLPLPAPLESFLMLGLFELLREAGERLPKAVGQTVAVVGGIVVGDAAIRAGLASTTFLVIASVTAVASFTLVHQSLVGSVSIIRLLVLLCSAVLGMYGFILSTIAILLYWSSLQSFGVPYLAPLSPINFKDIWSAVTRKPILFKKGRADILRTTDHTRLKEEP